MNFRKNFQSKDAGFQMAPMVDIVFLLLIFFMVATVYAQWETKVGITVPTADTGTQTGRVPGEIIINLDDKGEISINSISMTSERLQEILIQIEVSSDKQSVIIRADKKTDYEQVINVLDICRKVRIWNISFATLPSDH